MKEFEGKSCRISIQLNGNELYFLAKNVHSVTDEHITFTDKFGDTYTFRKSMIQEISS